jgi:hypothetical protein
VGGRRSSLAEGWITAPPEDEDDGDLESIGVDGDGDTGVAVVVWGSKF